MRNNDQDNNIKRVMNDLGREIELGLGEKTILADSYVSDADLHRMLAMAEVIVQMGSFDGVRTMDAIRDLFCFTQNAEFYEGMLTILHKFVNTMKAHTNLATLSSSPRASILMGNLGAIRAVVAQTVDTFRKDIEPTPRTGNEQPYDALVADEYLHMLSSLSDEGAEFKEMIDSTAEFFDLKRSSSFYEGAMSAFDLIFSNSRSLEFDKVLVNLAQQADESDPEYEDDEDDYEPEEDEYNDDADEHPEASYENYPPVFRQALDDFGDNAQRIAVLLKSLMVVAAYVASHVEKNREESPE